MSWAIFTDLMKNQSSVALIKTIELYLTNISNIPFVLNQIFLFKQWCYVMLFKTSNHNLKYFNCRYFNQFQLSKTDMFYSCNASMVCLLKICKKMALDIWLCSLHYHMYSKAILSDGNTQYHSTTHTKWYEFSYYSVSFKLVVRQFIANFVLYLYQWTWKTY